MTMSKPPNEAAEMRRSEAPVVHFCMGNTARQLEELQANSEARKVPFGAVTQIQEDNKQ